MITLRTKNACVRGNAILYGAVEHPEVGQLMLVETDFGNRMRLTSGEVNEMFEIGEVRDYQTWRDDREHLRLQNECADQEKASG